MAPHLSVSDDNMVETTMVFYIHDLLSGNATATVVAGVKSMDPNVLEFGTVVIIDDPLTEGQDLASKPVGRTRGMYVNTALNDSQFYMLLSVVFTEGEYNGNTLEIQGVDRYPEERRELSVVSGTGAFRFARGYAVIETVTFDGNVSLDAILKMTVTVRHPQAI